MKTIETNTLKLSYLGPDLSIPARTVFYFSLSAEDTLNTLPFAYPAKALEKKGVRVMTTTLPLHEKGKPSIHIQEIWSKEHAALEAFVENFLSTISSIDELKPPFGVMGLSRGAYIAMNLAARSFDITSIVGYAPLISLENESALALSPLTPILATKKLKLYIGHQDKAVGTDKVIALYYEILSHVEKKHLSTAEIQLLLSPSAGSRGHGTQTPIFDEGVEWMLRHL